MAGKKRINITLKWMASVLSLAAGAYAGYAGVTWLRYGRPAHARSRDLDPLLDRFMPVYDIVERHHIGVAAPADVTFAAACEIDMQRSPIIRAIFRAREVILGSEPDTAARPHGLLAWSKSLGWGVLAETPDREIVMGAVTQPWKANVLFRPLSPDAFTTFNEPGFVKIAWTLRADATGSTESVFRTETRAVATDVMARTRFRRYWSLLSPGIIVIRRMMLQPLKAEAERRGARFVSLESGGHMMLGQEGTSPDSPRSSLQEGPVLPTLFAILIVAALYWFPIRRWMNRWGATPADRARAMAGDGLLPDPMYSGTTAITVHASPEHIWPWLVQIGYQRGGLYSYDWLDRLFGYLDRPSATRILPEFQNLAVGDTIPMGQGPSWPVAVVEPRRALVLDMRNMSSFDWVWQFGLYPLDETRTQLVSRSCVRPLTLWARLFTYVIEPAGFVMTRRMLLGIKQRAEGLTSTSAGESRDRRRAAA
jgi:hypothetical protein